MSQQERPFFVHIPEAHPVDLQKIKEFRITAIEDAPGMFDEKTWEIAQAAFRIRMGLDNPAQSTITLGSRVFPREDAQTVLERMCMVIARNTSPEAATAIGSDVVEHEGGFSFANHFLPSDLKLQA